MNKLNNDPSIHGIIVQLPLDSVNEINSDLVVDSIAKNKDVDGYDFTCLLSAVFYCFFRAKMTFCVIVVSFIV